MKKHSGMRPLDILVLLKMISLKQESFFLKDLALNLGISISEVSESVNRSMLAGLIAADKKTIMRNSLFDFLIHGLPYVFPQKPGPIVPGTPTAHSANPLKKYFKDDEIYVWQSSKGKVRGQSIEPFHKGQLNAVENDKLLYELLALTDCLRVGKAREKNLAKSELQKRLLK